MNRPTTPSALSRRSFLGTSAAVAMAPALASRAFAAEPGRRVHILGIDAMDHALTTRLIAEGRLPNFARLAARGCFHPLGSSIPPQSPVAWSDFAIGADSGVHGIGDFIHRDPDTMMPVFSMARVEGSKNRVHVGAYSLPLDSGRVELMRRGRPFWDFLADAGIPSRVLKIPANFPPAWNPLVKALAGMGTPDLLGSYGTFTLLTSDPAVEEAAPAGGVVRHFEQQGQAFTGRITGPSNDFRSKPAPTHAVIHVYTDSENPVARIQAGDSDIILREGEWSDWIRLEFPLLGALSSTSGIVRVFLSSVRPFLRMYVSPVNIDPVEPALPIASPLRYSRQLARAAGRFYTQSMPEDTKGLAAGALTDAEYWQQAQIVLDESIRLYEAEAPGHQDGLFYFYFSTIDQVSHGMWRQFDPSSPTYSADFAASHGNVVEQLYERMDVIVGEAMGRLDRPDDVLLVVSDHGFAPFFRQVELNQWLRREGYLAVRPEAAFRTATLADIDWSRTRAYNIGLNAIYINQQGRERDGIVAAADAPALARQIRERLLTLEDPEGRARVFSEIWPGDDIFHGPQRPMLPDLVVGFRPPYRISWRSAVGEAPAGAIVKVNPDKWSGDHCADPLFVPGVLFSSVPLSGEAPHLRDMGPTVLGLYGLPTPGQMTGRSLVTG